MQRTLNHTKSTKYSPVTYLKALVPIQLPWCLAHVHTLHKLGNANAVAREAGWKELKKVRGAVKYSKRAKRIRKGRARNRKKEGKP
jgi:hypothetical protein